MTNPATVAVVGTGRMGSAIAGTLSRAGFPIVLYNRTRPTAETVAQSTGGRVTGSPREAAAGANVVLSSLADDAAVMAAYSGSDGIAAGLREGAVAVDASTIDPATIRLIRPLVEARGASLLDAPVSGSVALVEQGKLTIMVGGEKAAFEVARPIFDALAARTFHLGDLGAGATVKLAVNALVHAINTALSEALVLAEKAGVDRALVYEVFMASGGCPIRSLQGERLPAPRVFPGCIQPGSGRQGSRLDTRPRRSSGSADETGFCQSGGGRRCHRCRTRRSRYERSSRSPAVIAFLL